LEIRTYPLRRKINWAKPPKATDRVSSDYICTDGVRFTGSFRTVAHMASMMDDAKRQGLLLQVIQPPFHTGVGVSEGTHDKDACSDVRLVGLTWPEGQRWLRRRGFDTWWRHTGDWADPSDWHFHGFTHPVGGQKFATKVGIYIDGGYSQNGVVTTSSQLEDYQNQAFGLEGMHEPGSDRSWFPNKPYPTFDLSAYIRSKQEETMEYKDWSQQSKREFASDMAGLLDHAVTQGNRDLLSTQVSVRNNTNDGFMKVSLRQAWGRAANATVLVRDKATDIKAILTQADKESEA